MAPPDDECSTAKSGIQGRFDAAGPSVSASAGGRLVLVCGRDPLLTSGGTESYAVGHAKAAILAGYTPHVFSIAPTPGTLDTDFGFLHRVRSPVRPPRSITSVLQRPWLVPAVVRFLEASPGPHVIHGFGAWADTVVTSCRRLSRRGVEAVPVATVFMTIEDETSAKLHSTVVQQTPRWRGLHRLELAWVKHVTASVESRALRSVRAVVVNYENVQAALEQAYGPGLPIRRLTYSPPTAFGNLPAGAPLPEPLQGVGDPTAPLIVSVSRHDGRKGLDVLIEALAGLHEAGVAFRACLVGPGLLLGAHRRRISSRGLDSQVLAPGRVPDVMPYLLNADLYVLPSRMEGSGSVAVLEALQAGAPIVASRIDGLLEDLRDGHDAVLVTPGDPVALQRALVSLISDPVLRARLRTEARATFERRFAGSVTARQLASFYSELGLRPNS
jgi:glycosyltransferase involved in cell wall biosynthesis